MNQQSDGTLILHLIDEFRIGGAQTHLVTMLREAIGSFPVRHCVLTLFGDGPTGDRLRELGVDVSVLDLRPLFARRRFLAAAREIEAAIRSLQPDLVEAHLTWSRLLGLYAAKRAGVPRRIGFEQGDIYLSSWKFRLANRLGQVFANRIVVCSHALADWNRRVNGIAPGRLSVLHNCVDLTRFHPPARPVDREIYKLPPGCTLFCAVGTLGRGVNKRVDVCIRALAEARVEGADVALLICGDGDQRVELESLAVRLGVGSSVRFLGCREDVETVLAACDAFCHAAPFEPFGIVCVEAMATGLPVLVPDSGGVREAVRHGETGFVYRSLNVKELAAAMGLLHARPDLRQVMGRAARQDAEMRFSAQRYVTRLYELYGITGIHCFIDRGDRK